MTAPMGQALIFGELLQSPFQENPQPIERCCRFIGQEDIDPCQKAAGKRRDNRQTVPAHGKIRGQGTAPLASCLRRLFTRQ